MKLIFNAPINDLSFGNIGLNLLREFYKKDDDVAVFTHGKVDVSAYTKIDDSFGSWLQNSINHSLLKLDKEIPTLNLWHINGAHKRISKKQFLFTFHETDSPTFTEKKICSFQDGVIVTNKETKESFEMLGCNNFHFVNLGFDPDFEIFETKKMEDKIHFGLMGKYEKRKHTKEIIQTWLKKYGNNNKYFLTCCITNPFIDSKEMIKIIEAILDFKHYTNINFLPRLKTNYEVNHFLNTIDIDLTGMSGAEGWNIPSFNATALGKWSIVYNHTGHKSWAKPENCILLEAPKKEDCYDGLFFIEGGQYNQGKIYSFNENQAIQAMEYAETKFGTINKEGLKLQKDFSYEKTADDIKKILSQ